jgi:hypothetical protein
MRGRGGKLTNPGGFIQQSSDKMREPRTALIVAPGFAIASLWKFHRARQLHR